MTKLKFGMGRTPLTEFLLDELVCCDKSKIVMYMKKNYKAGVWAYHRRNSKSSEISFSATNPQNSSDIFRPSLFYRNM